MSLRVEQFNGSVIYIALDPTGVWARSRFPDPFITADYDVEDKLIGISAAGPRAQELLKSLVGDLEKLVQQAEGGAELERHIEQALAEAVG